MTPYHVLSGLAVLTVAVCLGVLAHELLHAACLRAAGVPSSLRLGGGRRGWLGAGLGAIASVQIERVPAGLAPWQLRVASLSPLLLAAPLLAIPLGIVPDPFAGTNQFAQVALIGWLACALPSPQDFSLFWHAEAVVTGEAGIGPGVPADGATGR